MDLKSSTNIVHQIYLRIRRVCSRRCAKTFLANAPRDSRICTADICEVDLLSSKSHIHHALPAGKSFATGQGQGEGFLLCVFCNGFAGDGWMDLLAQYDRFKNRALVLLVKIT